MSLIMNLKFLFPSDDKFDELDCVQIQVATAF